MSGKYQGFTAKKEVIGDMSEGVPYKSTLGMAAQDGFLTRMVDGRIRGFVGVDTQMLDVTYRIASFLATGLTLVGVSYLYQYLEKKGFFEAVRQNHDAASQDQHRADNARPK